MATDDAACCRLRHRPYDEQKVVRIRWAYIIMAVVWIALLVLFGICKSDPIAIIILSLPLLSFVIGFISAPNITPEVEESLVQTNSLSVGLLIVLPLLTWMSKSYNGNRREYISILVLAILLSLLALFDWWVGTTWFSVVLHLKSGLQAMALSLILYAVYIYYMSGVDGLPELM